MANPMADGITLHTPAPTPPILSWVLLAHRWVTDLGPSLDPGRVAASGPAS